MLQKIYLISSYLWTASCWGFAVLVAFMTKFMTYDPTLGTGAPEHAYLIPMFALIALGFSTFGIAILTWIIANIKKIKLATKHFWISSGLVGLLTVICIMFMIGVRNGNLGYKKLNYTGQELFNAVNEYRVANGKKQLSLELSICDNLVARYLKIKSGDVGHEGMEEWAKGEGMDKLYSLIGELYIKDSYTTKDAIKFWSGSPGHNLTLLSEEVSVGCAYANEGTGVVIVGEPIKK